ncbi:MAG: GTPase/DUF3482 domain-containing protein [Natronospirillum sp.]|uniref:DUF3482 domain-containing protein n=1 Tax=Natronospirillum sp. TaxID=2812955 RepID=UPI0025EA8A5E|nr:DUF3482 domain-containing protein [Natronospirillum sp.]MCH8552829.1 GTPase/DUF3482 domain-containing protein [Natronospirillum sp.]
MNIRRAPHLCVVGHPNKGKSSIVSTLAENDSVRVGAESGTTRHADTFEFIMDGQVMLSLTDTPGFQRARQALAWLQAESVAPAQRPERVRAFLAEPEHQQRFPDECELLRPVMAGAGILYVVDAAQPVTAADEAEMEILRWTGQPRMAVINPMQPLAGELTDNTWARTLNQYFQWVREFNPLAATLPARQSLLRALGELTAEWQQPIARLCAELARRDQDRLGEASRALAQYWCEQMACHIRLKAAGATQPEQAREQLMAQLVAREQAFFRQLASGWGHHQARLEQVVDWDLGPDSLMHSETWTLWGLKQRDLLLVSGGAGAAGGLAVDAGLGGSSLMLGALSGGLIGSASGWWAGRQLSGNEGGSASGKQSWLRRLPMVREQQIMGPVRHPNFPLVVMARALTLTRQLWLRPHAQRDALALRTTAADWPRDEQARLLQWARAIQRPLMGRLAMPGKSWSASAQGRLMKWISKTLTEHLDQALHSQEQSVWRRHD